MTSRALVALSCAAAVAWAILNLESEARGALVIVKGATVGALALAALLQRASLPGGALLAVALAAHAAGDVLLELSLLAGVAAFFLGHLGYFALFWPERRAVGEIGGASKLLLGLLALLAALFLARLAPALDGAERWAIPVYVAALVSMAGSAVVCRRGRPWVPLGALLFLVSDALLSFGLFGAATESSRLVWPLYAGGQIAIACGWIFRGGERESPRPA